MFQHVKWLMILGIIGLLLPSPSLAAWRHNQFTGKLDYYETGGGGTECASSSCDLNAATTLNTQNICLADGTDCPVSGSGDSLTVNSTAVDTTGDFADNIYMDFTHTDGGAGGPDTINSIFNYNAASGNHALLTGQCAFAVNGFVCEGTTADNAEVYLQVPDTAGGDITLTFPDETGTICTTGSVCSGYQASGSYLASTDIDAYSELNTIVADVTLTHNGLIDTFAELDAIVADESLVNTDDVQVLTNKTINDFTNTVHADATHFQCRNESGDAIVAGTPIYISGFSVGQDLILISPADADGSGTMPGVGVVAQASLANNATGHCVAAGRVTGLDTSAWTAGDVLYISDDPATTLGLTSTKPVGETDLLQPFAVVLKSNNSTGILRIIGKAAVIDAPNLDSGAIFVGNSSNNAAAVDMTGGVTISNTGVTTVVTNANLTGPITSTGNATAVADDVITHAMMLDADQMDSKCIWFENPTAADDFKSIWFNGTANDFQVTEIWAESDQTVTFMIQLDDGSPDDCDTVDLAPAAGTAEDTSLNGDCLVSAGERLDLDIASVANTPTWVSICWTGNWVD